MLSAAIDAVSTQLPSATAVTVVPLMVQMLVFELVHVISPLPLVPEVESDAVPPGRKLVLEADAVIDCEARLTVKVTAVDPAVKRVVAALVAVIWQFPVAVYVRAPVFVSTVQFVPDVRA